MLQKQLLAVFSTLAVLVVPTAVAQERLSPPATRAAEQVPQLLRALTGADRLQANGAASELALLAPSDLAPHQSEVLAAARVVAAMMVSDPETMRLSSAPHAAVLIVHKLGPAVADQAIPVLESILAAAPAANHAGLIIRGMTAYGQRGVTALERMLEAYDPGKTRDPAAGAVICRSICFIAIYLGADAAPLAKRFAGYLQDADVELRIAALKALASIGPAAASETSRVESVLIEKGAPPDSPSATLPPLRNLALQRMAGKAPPVLKNIQPVRVPAAAGGPMTPQEVARDQQMLRFILTQPGRNAASNPEGWAILGEPKRVEEAVLASDASVNSARMTLIQTLARANDQRAATIADRMVIAHYGRSMPLQLALWTGQESAVAGMTSLSGTDDYAWAGKLIAESMDHPSALKLIDLSPRRGDLPGQSPRAAMLLHYAAAVYRAGRLQDASDAFERYDRMEREVGEHYAPIALTYLAAMGEGERVVRLAGIPIAGHRRREARDFTPGFDLALPTSTLAYVGDLASARKMVSIIESDPLILLGSVRVRNGVFYALMRRGDAPAARAWLDESAGRVNSICKSRHSAERLVVAVSMACVAADGYQALGDEAAARKTLHDAGIAINAERGMPLTPLANNANAGLGAGQPIQDVDPNAGVGGDPLRPRNDQPAAPLRDNACDDALVKLVLAQHARNFTEDGRATAALVAHRIKRDSVEQDLDRPAAAPIVADQWHIASTTVVSGIGDWQSVVGSSVLWAGVGTLPPPTVMPPRGLPVEPVLDKLAKLIAMDRLESWQQREISGCITVLGQSEEGSAKAADILERSKVAERLLLSLAQCRADVGDKAGSMALCDRASRLRPKIIDTTAVTSITTEARVRISAGDKSGAMVLLRRSFIDAMVIEDDARSAGLAHRRAYEELGEVWTYAADAVSAWRFASSLPDQHRGKSEIRAGVYRGLYHRLTGGALPR